MVGQVMADPIDYEPKETADKWGQPGWLGSRRHAAASWRVMVGGFFAAAFLGVLIWCRYGGLAEAWSYYRVYGNLKGYDFGQPSLLESLTVTLACSGTFTCCFALLTWAQRKRFAARIHRIALLSGLAAGMFCLATFSLLAVGNTFAIFLYWISSTRSGSEGVLIAVFVLMPTLVSMSVAKWVKRRLEAERQRT
jgi:hypothetical protein